MEAKRKSLDVRVMFETRLIMDKSDSVRPAVASIKKPRSSPGLSWSDNRARWEDHPGLNAMIGGTAKSSIAQIDKT